MDKIEIKRESDRVSVPFGSMNDNNIEIVPDYDDELIKDKNIPDKSIDGESDFSDDRSENSQQSLGSNNDSDRSMMSNVSDDPQQKAFFLYQINKLQQKGRMVSRNFSMDNSSRELKQEVDRLKKEVMIDNAIRYQRQGLTFFTSTLEFLNGKFDPFDLELAGWSESVQTNIESFDDIFEELYEKYHNKVHVAPEIKLMTCLVSSALMFHASKSFLKNVPNFANNVNNNSGNVNNNNSGNVNNENASSFSVNVGNNKQNIIPKPDVDELMSRLDEADYEKQVEIEIPQQVPKKRGRKSKAEKESMIMEIN